MLGISDFTDLPLTIFQEVLEELEELEFGHVEL